MNKKSIFICFALLGIFFVSFFLRVSSVLAEKDNIKYPVADLGNCKDKDNCKRYCDQPDNLSACISFAEKNGLMSKQELKEAKKFIEAGGAGPGGCASKNECEKYCDDIDNINECLKYAEDNDLLPADELAEAKKVQAAVNRGIKPPCGSKKECDTFCERPDNMKACIIFAEEAGFLNGEELEDAKKMLSALDKGVKPLPCRGKEECDSYCADESHINECITFAEAAGFMSAKDAEMARKTGGKGPGGCKGKEECEAFCRDNQEACFNFAKENGLISEEELQRMEEGNKQFNTAINSAPPEVRKCLEEKFGSLDGLKPSQEIGDKMKECFEKFGGPGNSENQNGKNDQNGPQGERRGEIRVGPGGCSSREECELYCRDHMQECASFGGNSGIPQDGRAGQMPPSGPRDQYPSQGGFPPPGENFRNPQDGQIRQMPPLDPRDQYPSQGFPPSGAEGQYPPFPTGAQYTPPPSGEQRGTELQPAREQFPQQQEEAPQTESSTPVSSATPPQQSFLGMLANILFGAAR